MEAPDKIYIRTYPYDNSTCPEWLEGEGINSGVISRGVVLYEDIPYIRKEALLEWAREYKKAIEVNGDENDAYTRGEYSVINSLIDKIKSL